MNTAKTIPKEQHKIKLQTDYLRRNIFSKTRFSSVSKKRYLSCRVHINFHLQHIVTSIN